MQSLDASQRGGGATAACLATGVGIRQCLSRRRLIEYLLANGAGARVDPRIVGPCRASLNVKFGGCHSNNSIRPINFRPMYPLFRPKTRRPRRVSNDQPCGDSAKASRSASNISVKETPRVRSAAFSVAVSLRTRRACSALPTDRRDAHWCPL